MPLDNKDKVAPGVVMWVTVSSLDS